MKKITSLLIALVAITAAYAQNNNLVVFSQNGERFTLVLNGIRQNAKPETNVKVTGLNAPNYKAKIIFEQKNLFDVDQNIYMMSGGEQGKNMEYTYNLTKKKDAYKLKWMSEAPVNTAAPVDANQTVVTYTTTEPVLAVNVNAPTNTNAGTTSSQTTTTTTTTTTAPTTTTTTGTGQNMSVGVNVNGVGMNMNVNINDGTGMNGTATTTSSSSTSYSTTVTTTSSSSGTTTDVYDNNTTTTAAPVNNSTACITPMSSGEFADAKKSIASKNFSDTQLTLAKQIIDANCMSTAQVKEIMEIFSFEDTRLDLAKYAYNKTTDPKNYYKLNDAFKFESTIEELDKYVKSQKK